MARILLAVEGTGQPLRVVLEPKHEIEVVTTLRAAYQLLETQRFDVIVCDVCFDGSQMFELWSWVRKTGQEVIFLAYRERDSEMGESMELLVKKAVFNMGLAGYLDLRDFAAPGCDGTVLLEFIELGLKAGQEPKSSRKLVSALGAALKSRRLKLGISLEELANASGLKMKLLKDLESGKQADLEMTELWKLALSLDALPSKLLREAENEGP